MASLEQQLRTKILASGPITYREFVETVLYDQHEGYYRNGKPDGRDFLTSPEVHTAFGETIARYALHLADSVGEERFSILELGGGTGRLGRTITSVLPQDRLERYVILENARNDETSAIVYIDRVEKLPIFDSFTVVIANEFFDALPFHRVVMLRSGLREVYLSFEEGFVDLPQPLSPALAAFLDAYPVYLNEHQTIEVTAALAAVGPALSRKIVRGALLVFDYGYHVEDIALGAYFDGSMVSYGNYTMRSDVFSQIGERDISHHVNFDHLTAILTGSGWKKEGEIEQYRFLNNIGMGRSIVVLPPLERRSARMLMDPEGIGSVFRVLGFSKPTTGGLPGFGLSGSGSH